MTNSTAQHSTAQHSTAQHSTAQHSTAQQLYGQCYLAVVSLLIFFVATLSQFYQSFSWGHGSWQITEWLINYSGGFVRRGLTGQIIFDISRSMGVPGNYLAIGISLLSFLILIWFFFRNSNGKISITLICSPILLGLAAYQELIIRKDVLGILLLILCFYIEKNIASINIRTIFINAVGIFAILSHEAFFFFGFPSLVAIRAIGNSCGGAINHRNTLMSLGAFMPMVMAFSLTSIFRGNSDIADAINLSLSDVWRHIEPARCCFDQPNAAIDALQWTPTQGLSLSYSVLFRFSMGIYVPFAWFFSVFFCFIYLISLLKLGSNNDQMRVGKQLELEQERNRLALILVFQFIVIFPLFILGWDFGRWIFIWTVSSVSIYLIGLSFEPIVGVRLLNQLDKILRKSYLVRYQRSGICCFLGFLVVVGLSMRL